MILITGGLGFIGSHTTRALLDSGESCVVVGRRATALPDDFGGIAESRLVLEQADITDRAALLDVGKRHSITGIVHLAGHAPWPPGTYEPVDGAARALDGLLNVFRAAREWQVARLGIASTVGVYGGVAGEPPYREDLPLPMTFGHVLPTFLKVGELLAGYLAAETGIEVVNYRIGAIWGPRGRAASPFFGAPQFVHAAVRGTTPDLSTLRWPAYADDGIDLCYVKDCARAIALLHTTERLNHATYNVATGRPTTYRQLADAITKLIPDARIELPAGRNPDGPGHDTYLDITRIREDTGYVPAYDVESAVADYVDWLRTGHER